MSGGKKPGPSREYRDLLRGRITPDEYVKMVKKVVDQRLREGHGKSNERRAAAG
jgi:hypothetical protein